MTIIVDRPDIGTTVFLNTDKVVDMDFSKMEDNRYRMCWCLPTGEVRHTYIDYKLKEQILNKLSENADAISTFINIDNTDNSPYRA